MLREKIGFAYVNTIENPTVAIIGRKDIICFVAGKVEDPSVSELLDLIPQKSLIFVPDEKWVQKLKGHWGERLKAYPRTKFSSETLDINYMQEIQKKLPDGLEIRKITSKSITYISDQAKSVVNIIFPSIDTFIERNFGFGIFEGEKIASLALAATPIYNNHFEIHIETDPEYQRRGLALIICAKLIEYSLQNDLIPHWDADNEPSAKLALKLGFSQPEKYNAYYLIDSN